MEAADIPTPIGTFRIVYDGREVHTVDLLERGVVPQPLPTGIKVRKGPFPGGSPPKQLAEYFRGTRSSFDVDFEPETISVFDRSVYRALLGVPAGRTITYGELARRAGHAGSARAVGGAMHRNPIPIMIPCHRVVSEDSRLTGFGLGLWRKRWLLDREGSWPLRSGTPEGPKGRSQTTLDSITEVELKPTRRSAKAAVAGVAAQPA